MYVDFGCFFHQPPGVDDDDDDDDDYYYYYHYYDYYYYDYGLMMFNVFNAMGQSSIK